MGLKIREEGDAFGFFSLNTSMMQEWNFFITCSYCYLLLQYLHPILRGQNEASSCFALEKLKTELLLKSFSPSVLVSILPFPVEVLLPLVFLGRRLPSACHLVWIFLPGRYKACHTLTALRKIIISFRGFRGY